MTILKAIAGSVTAALIMLAGAGCCKNNADEPVNENRKVLLFYECAFNNIGSYMKKNIASLENGYIPGKNGDVILVYARYSKTDDSYTPTKSHLWRVYKNAKGRIVSDTLKVFDESTIASSPSTLREVLSFAKENFPAKGYGMVFSSHGSGWLPAGYYTNPTKFENEHKSETGKQGQGVHPAALADLSRLPVPESDLKDIDPYYGMTRSIGQDFIRGSYYGHEMTVREFSDAIPYHLDYLLFDMCFIGSVEVAYGLKDKADYLGLSPTEVLGYGMYDYTKIGAFLLDRKNPDLEGLFKDAYEMYDKQSGVYRSATVNLIRTDGLENLANVCKKLVSSHSEDLKKAPTSDIQGYFRSNRHYFYDLADIFDKCGATEAEMKELNDAIDRCVVYRKATKMFLNTFAIDNYSGFSMYLPCAGTPLLDSYYKKEAWNDAVGLVK